MQLTITIADKAIKNAAEYVVENHLFDDWNAETLKRAGVPKKADLVKQMVTDEKFIAHLSKQLGKYVDDGDLLYDVVCDMDYLNKFYQACEKAADELDAEESAKEEALQAKHAAARAKAEQARKEAEEEATVARVIAALKKQGYKIEKA